MRVGKLPKKLYKKHSLKAWGYRLGEYKGDYGEQEGAWQTYSPEMLDYCKQDVQVTVALYKRLTKGSYSKRAIELEHEVAWLMAQQERNGFPFDREGAENLERILRERQAIKTSIQTAASRLSMSFGSSTHTTPTIQTSTTPPKSAAITNSIVSKLMMRPFVSSKRTRVHLMRSVPLQQSWRKPF